MMMMMMMMMMITIIIVTTPALLQVNDVGGIDALEIMEPAHEEFTEDVEGEEVVLVAARRRSSSSSGSSSSSTHLTSSALESRPRPPADAPNRTCKIFIIIVVIIIIIIIIIIVMIFVIIMHQKPHLMHKTRIQIRGDVRLRRMLCRPAPHQRVPAATSSFNTKTWSLC